MRSEPRDGFTLLDGGALVLGAAVASVHLRDLVAVRLTALGWALAWLTFTGLALTAAGPFVFLGRRLLRRQPDYPRVGDGLWALYGLPWLGAAFVRPLRAMTPAQGVLVPHPARELYSTVLWMTLIPVTAVGMIAIWRCFIAEPGRRPTVARSWTNRVGLAIAVAWPLQWGFGLVVVG